MKRYATKADRAAADAITKRNIFPEMVIAGVVIDQRTELYKAENLTISSPPETAQELDS